MSKRIVVGVDGSESSKAALLWAAAQASVTGSALEVAVIWDDDLLWMPALGQQTWDPVENVRLGVTKIVRELVGSDPEFPICIEAIVDKPADGLLRLAEGADLLVVGCRGYGPLVGALFGSVSLYCVTHAKCPVLVTHQANCDHQDPLPTHQRTVAQPLVKR
jgi:nucleotide-binding universal stress UspA family protein